ncbi:hypothetical protein BSZ39_12515 [Bowdeniella nasicola]|uniref:Uncharacterized protein n=1 Tax=Bowdeniella nasicola TaxID=208480 RepID=A0A1Q5PYN5_9ACTO|nr:hypothetical protein [Bowdeniella nasicola]OKL52545.1 hypothetical protein BSZ39_12515 [Bowdeniella nasicola]
MLHSDVLDAGQRRDRARIEILTEPEVERLCAAHSVDERCGAALSNNPPVIDHGDLIAQALCLVHEMGDGQVPCSGVTAFSSRLGF